MIRRRHVFYIPGYDPRGVPPYYRLFRSELRRLADRDDVLVGTPIANRSRREIEGLIGFFANTLVLRADLSGDPTFAELLARVRRGALDIHQTQIKV